MNYVDHMEISYCTVFNLKLSQDELEVYERAMNFLLENCNELKIFEATGCTIEELKGFREDVRELFNKYVRREILPDIYKDTNC